MLLSNGKWDVEFARVGTDMLTIKVIFGDNKEEVLFRLRGSESDRIVQKMKEEEARWLAQAP